jgi:hypothetical protein
MVKCTASVWVVSRDVQRERERVIVGSMYGERERERDLLHLSVSHV